MFNLAPKSGKRLQARRENEYPVQSLQRQVNRLFEDFFSPSDWEDFEEFPLAGSGQSWGEIMPRIDMIDTNNEVLVKVELPGMTEKDVDVSITRDMLTICGEKKQEKEQSEKGWYRMERQYGSFTRSIPLPYEIESDKADAQFKNGLLTIKLPKSSVQQKGAKSIPVKSN